MLSPLILYFDWRDAFSRRLRLGKRCRIELGVMLGLEQLLLGQFERSVGSLRVLSKLCAERRCPCFLGVSVGYRLHKSALQFFAPFRRAPSLQRSPVRDGLRLSGLELHLQGLQARVMLFLREGGSAGRGGLKTLQLLRRLLHFGHCRVAARIRVAGLALQLYNEIAVLAVLAKLRRALIQQAPRIGISLHITHAHVQCLPLLLGVFEPHFHAVHLSLMQGEAAIGFLQPSLLLARVALLVLADLLKLTDVGCQPQDLLLQTSDVLPALLHLTIGTVQGRLRLAQVSFRGFEGVLLAAQPQRLLASASTQSRKE